MADVLLRTALLQRGYTDAELERLLRAGRLLRPRRGVYVWADGQLTPEARHRQLLDATLPQLRVPGVVSHASAAVLHGLPVWPDRLSQVHLTRPRVGGGKDRPLLRIHSTELDASELTERDGIRVTTLARTVADLARTLPLDQSVAAGDAALRVGMVPEDLHTTVGAWTGRPGVARAVLTSRLLDGRRESADESVSAVRMHQAGLPAPVPQFSVVDPSGRLVARCDVGWKDHGVVGEFDGRITYGRLLRPGQEAGDVVYREKLREDEVRDLGYRMVRWAWADLYPGAAFVSRLGRALRRP